MILYSPHVYHYHLCLYLARITITTCSYREPMQQHIPLNETGSRDSKMATTITEILALQLTKEVKAICTHKLYLLTF